VWRDNGTRRGWVGNVSRSGGTLAMTTAQSMIDNNMHILLLSTSVVLVTSIRLKDVNVRILMPPDRDLTSCRHKISCAHYVDWT
jgi:hypothetical protein